MKKIFCLAVTLLTAFSTTFSQKVSESEALSLSADFIQNKKANVGLVAPQTMETIVTSFMQNGNPAYYILQVSEGEGFVVMAANRASEPILGYSISGTFDPATMPPALQSLLDDYKAQLEYMETKRLQASPQIVQSWAKLTENGQAESPITVGPLIKTKWGQGTYYNSQCPTGGSLTANALTGCVATTMAQLMYYWSFPIREQTVLATDVDNDPTDGISGTFTAQVGGGYHWGNMPTQLNQSSTPLQVSEVANLMYDCGVVAKMNYGFSASGAADYEASHGMHNYFGYEAPFIYMKKDFSSIDWTNKLKTNLNAGYPIFYAGDGNGAHAWIVDGYQDDKFHMNWGWNGSTWDDQYWSLGSINPGIWDFTAHQRMFVPKPGGGCVPFAVLSGAQTNPNVEVAQWISASSTIVPLPGLTTTFNARKEIVLTPGFTAAQGTNFRAVLVGCDGLTDDPIVVDRTESVESTVSAAKPGEISIAPNPFSGSTTVTYSLEAEQPVAISLMDAMGKLVATPLPVQTQSEGEHQFNLEAGSLPVGMYFLVLQMGEKRETKRLILTN